MSLHVRQRVGENKLVLQHTRIENVMKFANNTWIVYPAANQTESLRGA